MLQLFFIFSHMFNPLTVAAFRKKDEILRKKSEFIDVETLPMQTSTSDFVYFLTLNRMRIIILV